jgi:hypothetical protein
MLLITLDTSRLEATLDSMLEQLKLFPDDMASELTEWQTKDMRRRYPNTEIKGDSVETDVWPTSRLQEQDRTKIRAAMKRGVIRKKPGSVRGGSSTRPILRTELYEKLVARMTDLMEERLSWR